MNKIKFILLIFIYLLLLYICYTFNNENDFENYNFFNRIESKVNKITNKNLKIKRNSHTYTEYYYDKKSIIELHDIKKKNVTYQKEVFKKINDKLRKNNINFLFLESPKKELFYSDVLNKYNYKIDYDSYNELYSFFSANSIDYIDTNKIIKKINKNRYQLFYNSDYHWTTNTAYLYTKYLTNYINKHYHYNLNEMALDEDNFIKLKYKNMYYGYNQRVFNIDNTGDDITYYLVKRDYKCQAIYSDKRYSGNYNDILFQNVKGIKPTYFNKSIMYQKILYGITDYREIQNFDIDNDLRILVLGDSNFNAMGTFIPLLFKNTDIIDIRTYKGSLDSYINSKRPNLVLYFIDTDSMLIHTLDKLFK